MSDVDVIVVGAGHNGLVAAARLARAGFSVLALERNDRLGGAVASAEVTRPGFVHDLYATNQNLFLASRAYADLKPDLDRHGLRYAKAEAAVANVFPDAPPVRLWADEARTLADVRTRSEADADGFAELKTVFDDFSQSLLPLLQTPIPSAAAAAQLAKGFAALGPKRTTHLAQVLLSSPRELAEAYFETSQMQALTACWGLHLDAGPDVSVGTMFPLAETFSALKEGISVVEGGASRMPDALAAVVREAGGEIRTGADVARVVVERRRAVGVELASGEQVGARRAVIANLSPGPLFGRLLADADLPADFRRAVRRYRYGPATMMLHLALDGPIPWRDEGLDRFAYVHAGPYVEDLARTYRQSMDGLIPDSPLLIVGQTTAVDPSRAPEGGHVAWIQVRTLPSAVRGDAAGEIDATDWDAAAERVADRVLTKLETYAPGVGARVLGRHVISPAQLERDNPNLVGGDSVAGSHHARQNFVFRPVAGFSRHRLPIRNLWMCGAGTWPGAGTNAASGWFVSEDLIGARRARTGALWGAAGAAVLAAAARARRG